MGKVADQCRILVVNDDPNSNGRVFQMLVGHVNNTEVELISRGDLFAQTKAWFLETHRQGRIPIILLDHDLKDALRGETPTGTQLLSKLMEDDEVKQTDAKMLILCTTAGDTGSVIAEWRAIPGVPDHCCLLPYDYTKQENPILEDELDKFYVRFPELAERTIEASAEVEATN